MENQLRMPTGASALSSWDARQRRPRPSALGLAVGFAVVALALLLAAGALVAAAAPAALAQTVRESWTCEFTGDAMDEHGSADIAKAVRNLQPGDSCEFTVDLYEAYDGSAHWYLRNQVIKSMEEAFATGGAYSYSLVYISPTGQHKTITSNETVSGDGASGTTEGLKDATVDTKDYFFLDTLASGARAKVILTVALDGESHGNPYFDTQAELNLSFAAERTSQPGTSGNGDDPNSPGADTDGGDGSTPPADSVLSQTGDMIRIGLIIAVVIAAAALAVVAAKRRRDGR